MSGVAAKRAKLSNAVLTRTVTNEGGDLRSSREPARALEHIHRLLPEATVKILPRLLRETAVPGQALNLLEGLLESQGRAAATLFVTNPILLHYVLVVFGHSYWLGESLLRGPEILADLRNGKNLDRLFSREEYRPRLARRRTDKAPLDSADLARFKKEEYLRIALRDLLGIATLGEITEEISALADVIIEEALRKAESEMRQRYGPCKPAVAPFAVLSLGKLGGNELNYSSDVDLLYLHGDGEVNGPLSLREFFIRQAQRVTEILSRTTTEGPAFRIDLRLRPHGNEGEPAVNLRQALHYYSHQAQDWELQALIKARYTAGDPGLARAFILGVQPQVYHASLNFAAIKTALDSREKIGARRRARLAHTIDVKLDSGGIRDIEFLVQCLQRAYGGPEPWLRSRGTLFSLQKLHDKGHLSGKDFHELSLAYEFLRKVEHRLQLQRGGQVHRLPAEPRDLEILERAVRTGSRQEEAESNLLAKLRSRMARVAEIYERVVHSERRRESPPADRLPLAETARDLSPSPSPSWDRIMQRVAADSPALGAVVNSDSSNLSLHARRNLHNFLSSALTSPDRYAAVLENPTAVSRAIQLFEASGYLTDILLRHPNVLPTLDEIGQAQIGKDQIKQERMEATQPSRSPDHPITESPDSLLRREFRSRSFAAGARDTLAPRDVFCSLREITGIGQEAIGRVLEITGGNQTLAVFALGRMGTEEFDIASDADLLFVRAPEADEENARRDAERLVHALSAYTREGMIFAVDTRLRPRGSAGELVVTPSQVERYLAEEALAWEALTYTKLRPVAGRDDFVPGFLAQVWRRITEIAARGDFFASVVDMRMRLEKSNRYPRSFKLGRGGFYDIDFLMSSLMLRAACPPRGNTVERLQSLRDKGVLDHEVANSLHDAAVLYRTADHVIRLVTGRSRPELPEAEHARSSVEKLVRRILLRESGMDLQAELAETATRVRKIFENVIQAGA